MPTDRKLRVAVECRIDDPRSGVGSAILALAHALSESKNLDQEYTFIVNDDAKAWLEPHIFGSCHLVGIERPRPSRIKPIFRNLTLLRTIWRSLRVLLFNPPKSDGYVESNGFDIVHFPTPSAYLTGLPSIYQPWDLQHLHFPRFFSRSEYALREREYRTFTDQAECVCVQTEWSRQDVIQQYGIAPEKVRVIQWG
jgi:hypothetical protein